ncbi:MAG: anti-sigma-28 factor FlgM [Bacillales bacterium]|jgi:negative regulator of flagellin synthesis FlgM|nr:anti-sigma-28 factor FlgM [Bacillales bacterium]
MKIERNNLGPVNPYKQHTNIRRSNSSSFSGEDKIEISSAALEMQESSKFLTERNERIEQIKKEINSGNFKVNEFEVAKSLYNYYFNNK